MRCIEDHQHFDPTLKSGHFPLPLIKKVCESPNHIDGHHRNFDKRPRRTSVRFLSNRALGQHQRRQHHYNFRTRPKGSHEHSPSGQHPSHCFHRIGNHTYLDRRNRKNSAIPISPKPWRIPSIYKRLTKSTERHSVSVCHGRTGNEKPTARRDVESRQSSQSAPAAKSKAEDHISRLVRMVKTRKPEYTERDLSIHMDCCAVS
ncbi:hypothetical protein HPB51_028579 [Rhipicephalus microplus]|uniref:Uncharacterized protein n=1 Tax=Rhipicephalus microplus TaxID=6941 RepID=A0A9J6CX67_RHIMP|nr:hypothetical protein HPB51_028579 [Rhipicephalus microplus]